MATSDGYDGQEEWKRIQAFLPQKYRFGDGALPGPSEDWWDWEGHRVHLDRFRNPQAKARVILFHGLGTNGRQMSTILGGPLHRSGLETVAIDMPGYGVTQVAKGISVAYDDWVRAGSDFIDAELAHDPRPIFLFGLSAGGMLGYHVAALNGKVKGIAGTTFLDQRIRQVADETAYSRVVSRVGTPLVRLAVRIGLGGLRVPMRMVSKMSALVNDEKALKAFYGDRTSAGRWASQRFLASYVSVRPAIEPEGFDICPVLLVQPAQDRWSPLHLSTPFLDRVKQVPVQVVMLENAGHYPLEEPGLTQLHDAVLRFVRENV